MLTCSSRLFANDFRADVFSFFSFFCFVFVKFCFCEISGAKFILFLDISKNNSLNTSTCFSHRTGGLHHLPTDKDHDTQVETVSREKQVTVIGELSLVNVCFPAWMSY